MLVTGIIPNRPDLSSNEPWAWSATLLVGSLKNFWCNVSWSAHRFPWRSAILNSRSLTARLSLSSESIPRDARQRQESSPSAFDQVFWVSLEPALPLF